MTGHLFFVLGVSGGGKGTLRKKLVGENSEQIVFLKSYVSRPMRPGEKNGENYWFISKNEFETAIQKNEFLEYEINHKTAYYGTKLADVEIGLKAGHTLMKEIDTKGLEQIIQKHPELRKYFTSFFLDIPNTEISRRYFERHPDGCDTDKNNRIESAVFEREQAKKYCDYIIDATQTPEQILQEVLKIIRK